MSRNLATVLTESAARQGDAVAIKLDDTELPYKFLDELPRNATGKVLKKELKEREEGDDSDSDGKGSSSKGRGAKKKETAKKG